MHADETSRHFLQEAPSWRERWSPRGRVLNQGHVTTSGSRVRSSTSVPNEKSRNARPTTLWQAFAQCTVGAAGPQFGGAHGCPCRCRSVKKHCQIYAQLPDLKHLLRRGTWSASETRLGPPDCVGNGQAPSTLDGNPADRPHARSCITGVMSVPVRSACPSTAGTRESGARRSRKQSVASVSSFHSVPPWKRPGITGTSPSRTAASMRTKTVHLRRWRSQQRTGETLCPGSSENTMDANPVFTAIKIHTSSLIAKKHMLAREIPEQLRDFGIAEAADATGGQLETGCAVPLR